jgi:aryl-alcohol dehydrogenase-like predicted oxidoreductase
MNSRTIGTTTVSAIALGAATLSFSDAISDEDAVAALRLAADEGITLFDTARVYTTADEDRHNERLVRDAFGDRLRDGSLTVSTKGGHYRTGDDYPIDGRAASVVADCEGSIRVLGVDAIDLYFLHWPDPAVSIEESVGALASLRERGLIRMVGVSNFSLDELKAAQRITTIDAVQNHFTAALESGVLAHAAADGIAYLDYSPLQIVSDWAAFSAHPAVVAALAHTGAATAQQLVLAWLSAHSPAMIPVSGATRAQTIRSSAAAMALSLTPPDLEALDALLAP